MSRFKALQSTLREIINLSKKSDILADQKSKIFCSSYLNLKNETKFELFKSLSDEHGLKSDKLFAKFQSLASSSANTTEFESNFGSNSFEKLNSLLTPEYYNLFKSLSRVSDGAKTIIKIREDLLDIIEKNEKRSSYNEIENLIIMNKILKDLLILLFSAGSLQLQRITWNSPASLVEKIAYFESVHPIRTLNELKIRLDESRRCFIFKHSSMKYEPLVILHVALTNNISSNILHLLRRLDETENITELNEHPTHAIFYSISSCQKGLKSIDLGNSLIKSCVNLLKSELPSLKNFHTLSPIPGYRAWLNTKLLNSLDEQLKVYFIRKFEKIIRLFEIDINNSNTFESLRVYLNSDEFKQSIFKVNETMKTKNEKVELCVEFLNHCCAYYLLNEKQRGYALNSVENFHIKNGAILDRINFGADLTDKGWKLSFSLMVNYTYNLNDLDNNCISYLNDKKISSSLSVLKFL